MGNTLGFMIINRSHISVNQINLQGWPQEEQGGPVVHML